jgi:hypothetical protein
MTTKKSTSAITTEPDSGEIQIPYGANRGGGGDHPHVGVVGKGELIVYPGEALTAHMSEWRHFGVALTYSGSVILGVKLTKGGGGRFLRTSGGRRPHIFIPGHSVVISSVDDPEPGDLGSVVGTVVDDDTVVLSLPKIITGSGRRYFRLSRKGVVEHD